MKKSEIVMLIQYLDSYYNKRFEIPSEEEKLDLMVDTWGDFLIDYNYKLAKTATKKLITRKEWPPTPGEIVQEIEQLTKSDEDKLTGGEAWERVTEAIRKYSYLYNPQKVKDNLPDKALRAAEVVGLNLIARRGGDSYVMNSYMKVYNNLEDKNKDYEMLPKSMREEVKQLSDQYTKNNLRLIENKEEAQ